MQLCFSCRHAFPTSSLVPCAFSEIIAQRFEEVYTIVNEIKPSTPEVTHQVLALQIALRELGSAVNQEISALKKSRATMEASRQRDRSDRELGAPSMSRIPTGTGIHSTMSNAQFMVTNASPNRAAVSPRATFNGSVPTYKLRKMNSALELVSASIYCVMESLAIRSRSEVALLWLTPPGVVSTELVAPFVVGRDTSKLRNSAPYRVSETSVPCAVSETGIAVNLKPKQGVTGTATQTLMDLIDSTNAAQLLIPVFTRYGDVQRTVLAVIHLIGTPLFPTPFSLRNEEMAVQTAATLSIILSSYKETMGGEWANRIFDPSLLTSTSAYHGTLDMRSHQKGLDDFAPPPTLIYRCVNERREDDGAREVVKALRHAMLRRGTTRRAVTSIKDLHRFAANMEGNWVAAVNMNTTLTSRVAELEDRVLRAEVEREAESRVSPDPGIQTIGSMRVGSISSLGKRVPSVASSVANALSPLPQIPNIQKGVLRPEQINEIEISALRRLQSMGVDTKPFVTQVETSNV